MAFPRTSVLRTLSHFGISFGLRSSVSKRRRSRNYRTNSIRFDSLETRKLLDATPDPTVQGYYEQYLSAVAQADQQLQTDIATYYQNDYNGPLSSATANFFSTVDGANSAYNQ